jgi:hypothetical protein
MKYDSDDNPRLIARQARKAAAEEKDPGRRVMFQTIAEELERRASEAPEDALP